MTNASIIDGAAFAKTLRARVAQAVAALKNTHSLTPGLAVVLIGEDPASQVYVRNKIKFTEEAGMQSFEHRLPESTSQEILLALLAQLNRDQNIHGILVQLPLPAHIDTDKVIATIAPAKDVDGLTPDNAGRLALGLPGLVPCTPLGALLLLRARLGDLSGQNAVIIGRSVLVGKPLGQLLLRENCTVTIAHSKTRDLPAICAQADILVAAIGRPQFVRGSWIKPGATVIDVGINRVPAADKEGDTRKTRLVGDVAFEEALAHVGAITPVPGGVGPMTIACLLRNTVEAAARMSGFALPDL
jgi:methylenetetrahydrofolate dehydrogenase (NADP+)/methenyltetrahydrofolate cyclohydrolase